MNAIPQELRDRTQWVNWKKIVRDGKPTKIPVQPNGKPASSTDPTTWHRYDELVDTFSGRGFVFSADDPYIGIDLDGCRNPKTLKLDDWAREIVLKFSTYAEVSPSDTGVKLFGVSDSIWKNSNKIELDGNGYGGKRPGIEVYDCGRYFAATGKRLKDMIELVNVDDQLDWLADKYGMRQQFVMPDGSDVSMDTPLAERAAKYVAKMDAAVAGQRGHDALFKVACALVLGFSLSVDEAYSIIAVEYNHRCDPPWNEREIRHKVESAAKQPGQRGYLRDAKPEQWNKIYVRSGPAPDFREAPEPEKTNVRITTLEEAAKRHLEQLAEGKDYLIETGIPQLDYAISGGLAPGEMVIVAGRPSHGKSAIALQMLHHMTANDVNAIIVSEEMSALALGKRAIQYAANVPEEHWVVRREEVEHQVRSHFENRKPTVVIESCGSVERVCDEVEKAVNEHGAGVVAIDYVQLLKAPGRSRYEEVTYASQEMRRLASRLGIVAIVLAQLNREIESRKRYIPQSSDLKETGQLEQDADVIIFGVWPHRIDASNPAKEYQFFVAKNRNRGINNSAFTVQFEPSRQMLIEEAASCVKYYEEFANYAN